MTLPIKEESIDYKLYKTLNEDVKLKSNNYGKFDIQFENEWEANRYFVALEMIECCKIARNSGLVAVEEALKGTKVRGCTKVIGNNPAVYMTCYLKEKSSFYFALYHELGHVKSDYNRAKSKVIIDGDDSLEKRADLFAVNQMIDEKTYKLILENFDDKETD